MRTAAMLIVHFTEVATDPLKGFSSHGARFVPLADGAGEDETFLSCLHLEPGGWISDPPADRDTTLLIVHGAVTFASSAPYTLRVQLSCGMGMVMAADTRYRLQSDWGAIVLLVEAERLEATECGISTPERILKAVWPGEQLRPERRTLLSMVRRVWFRWKWRKLRRLVRADRSAWSPTPSGDVVAGPVLDPFERRPRR